MATAVYWPAVVGNGTLDGQLQWYELMVAMKLLDEPQPVPFQYWVVPLQLWLSTTNTCETPKLSNAVPLMPPLKDTCVAPLAGVTIATVGLVVSLPVVKVEVAVAELPELS